MKFKDLAANRYYWAHFGPVKADLVFIDKIDLIVNTGELRIYPYLLQTTGIWGLGHTAVRGRPDDECVWADAVEPYPPTRCPHEVPAYISFQRAFLKGLTGVPASMPPGVPAPIPDQSFKITVHPRCECGAAKCGSNQHSTWCPRYQS